MNNENLILMNRPIVYIRNHNKDGIEYLQNYAPVSALKYLSIVKLVFVHK